MEIFDKVNRATIDRRDWQLSVLAIVMLGVFGAGNALLMYPLVFGRSAFIQLPPSRTLFFSFCALCMLMVGYMINRMFLIRRLRASLLREQQELAQLLRTSSAELLGTLMGYSHFQDRLAMDFRRAMQTREPLSLLVVRVKPLKMFTQGAQAEMAWADAAKVLSRKLRPEDSLYRLSSEVFAIVLPGATEATAVTAAARLSESLADASGASDRFTASVQVINYPDHAHSAAELEKCAEAVVDAA
jgi:GGDEF domain-containing protein